MATLFNKGVDLVLTYKILKTLATPFDKLPAYKAGIIDKNGKTLVHRKDFNDAQKNAMGYGDRMLINLKKVLEKIPGPSLVKNVAAAYFLLKEDAKGTMTDFIMEVVNEQELYEELISEGIALLEDGESAVPSNSISSHAFDPNAITKESKQKKKKRVLKRIST